MGLGTKNRQKQTADICKQHLREKYWDKPQLVEEYILEIEGALENTDVTHWGQFTDIKDIKEEMLKRLDVRFDKGEIVRNGAALHIDQGTAMTSHASQTKTVDQVIVSVSVRAFSQANEAQFYVSMSRARSAMHVFTDSKAALRDAVSRPGKRL
jgi:hypothetical protein